MAKRGNNEGSIYKRKDGRWTGAVTIGGGRASLQRKQFYGQTRQEVARKLTEALKATKDSVPLPLDRLTVGGFARDWLESIQPSIRPKTYESYEATVRVHIIPRFGHIRLAKLTPTDLERFYANLISNGAAPKSVRNYHAWKSGAAERFGSERSQSGRLAQKNPARSTYDHRAAGPSVPASHQ